MERGIQENLLEEDSELRRLVGDLPHLGLQTLTKGKLIVNNGNNILIPKEARAYILKELHSTHLSAEMMKNIFFMEDSSGAKSTKMLKEYTTNVKDAKEKLQAN